MRSGSQMSFLTLRDPSVSMSLQVVCSRTILTALSPPLAEGSRVVVHGRFEFYPARGSLTFQVDQIHPVGLGELLARLERLRQLLAAEGLTAPERKQRLPFLPRRRRADHRAGQRRRVRRAGQRQGTLARRPVPGGKPCGTGDFGGHPAAGGAGQAGRRPRGRRHRDRPRRRQRRGSAAVLRRGAVPGGLPLPHPGGLRDRPRTGPPDHRRCRRRPVLHTDRRRQAGGAGRRRRAAAGRATPRPRPAGPDRLGGAPSRPDCGGSPPRPCWPTR